MSDTHKSLLATVCDKMHRIGDELFADPKSMAADALAGVPHHTHHECRELHAVKAMEAVGHVISIPRAEAFKACAEGPAAHHVSNVPGVSGAHHVADTNHHA